MNITLVFPPFYLSSMYNLPPLGLINLATALKDTPHEVRLEDLVLAVRQGSLKMGKTIYDDCADMILDHHPDIVGLSAQCTTYPAILQISKRIKEKNPGIQIVLGGHNASFLDRETMERFPCVDIIIRGEGEITFKELIRSLNKTGHLDGIPGITWRRGEAIVQNRPRPLMPDLNALPLPDYSFLPSFSEYRDACHLPRSIAILEVGRGCPHHCIYCSESLMWQRKTRTFSVNRLVEEMETLHTRFGAECFLLSYDQFTAQRSFVEAFCHRVIHKGLNHLPWYCISRLDSVDASLLRLMREAGCESMCYGIDSGSERTLFFIRKRINRDILYERVVDTAKQGIIPTLSFVIGFPEETRQDIDETLALALRAGIVGNNNPLIQMPTVLPGTDLHTRYGKTLVRVVDTYFSLGLEFHEGRRLESDDRMINDHPLIFSSFYNLSCRGMPLDELGHLASYFPLMVQLYPRSFMVLSIDCEISISTLFADWLRWIAQHKEENTVSLTPRDVYHHFSEFAGEQIRKRGGTTRPYLPDLLRYETTAIAVAESPVQHAPFHMDLQQLKTLRPLKNDKIIIEAFDFDLPMIILDLKNGRFNESYTPEKTPLIFLQTDDTLQVLEINFFVKDFLTECDGHATLKDICRKLYRRHGKGVEQTDFFEACVEAVTDLGKNGLIKIH